MCNLFFELGGDVTFAIQISETHDAGLFFEVSTNGPNGMIAALDTLKLNLNDKGLLGGVYIDSPMVEATLKRNADAFDMGIAFDADSLGALSSNTVCFILRHKTDALKIAAVFEQSFGVTLNQNLDETGFLGALSNGVAKFVNQVAA